MPNKITVITTSSRAPIPVRELEQVFQANDDQLLQLALELPAWLAREVLVLIDLKGTQCQDFKSCTPVQCDNPSHLAYWSFPLGRGWQK